MQNILAGFDAIMILNEPLRASLVIALLLVSFGILLVNSSGMKPYCLQSKTINSES